MATQDMVDYHTELLSTVLSNTADFLRLHGNMTQNDRTHVFQSFKNAQSGVLICTVSYIIFLNLHCGVNSYLLVLVASLKTGNTVVLNVLINKVFYILLDFYFSSSIIRSCYTEKCVPIPVVGENLNFACL